MAAIGGYTNSFLTPFGNADFWVVTDLHYVVDVQTNTASVSVTLNGFPSQAEADAGMLSMGKYTFTMTPQQIFAVFSSAQTNVQAAILESNPAWANAVFVPPA
jgi:hypothetical protein